jgi:hypothetical protein
VKLLVVLAFKDRLLASINIHFRVKRVRDRFDDALLPDRVCSVKPVGVVWVENNCSLPKNTLTHPTTTSTRANGFTFFTLVAILSPLSPSFLTGGFSQPESPSCLVAIVSRGTASSDSALTVPLKCCFANAAHASMTCFCGGKQYCNALI